jgi:hypothetical protein
VSPWLNWHRSCIALLSELNTPANTLSHTPNKPHAQAHGFGDFLRRHLQGRNGPGRPRPIRRAPGNGSAGSGGAAGPSSHNSSSGPAASRGSGPASSSGRGSSGPAGGARGPPPPGSSSSLSGAAAAGGAAAEGAAAAGGCPMRKWLGPAAGLVFNNYGKLHCPEAIVVARAALARTAPVRHLRPQALPLKLLAVAATAAAINVPCGAWREHFEKFSLGWFVAVHATIPFVAMLRKAVVMPKLAIVVTIAAAVAGQVIGSRLERARLAQLAAERPQVPVAVAAKGRKKAAAAAQRPSKGAAKAAPPSPPAFELEALGGQLACAMASMTHSPRSARRLALPVTPLKV